MRSSIQYRLRKRTARHSRPQRSLPIRVQTRRASTPQECTGSPVGTTDCTRSNGRTNSSSRGTSTCRRQKAESRRQPGSEPLDGHLRARRGAPRRVEASRQVYGRASWQGKAGQGRADRSRQSKQQQSRQQQKQWGSKQQQGARGGVGATMSSGHVSSAQGHITPAGCSSRWRAAMLPSRRSCGSTSSCRWH